MTQPDEDLLTFDDQLDPDVRDPEAAADAAEQALPANPLDRGRWSTARTPGTRTNTTRSSRTARSRPGRRIPLSYSPRSEYCVVRVGDPASRRRSVAHGGEKTSLIRAVGDAVPCPIGSAFSRRHGDRRMSLSKPASMPGDSRSGHVAEVRGRARRPPREARSAFGELQSDRRSCRDLKRDAWRNCRTMRVAVVARRAASDWRCRT